MKTSINVRLSKLQYVLHLLVVCSLSFSITGVAQAHPGRTDSSGGHTCYTNCESWGLDYGEYHYHNGGGDSGGLSEEAQARINGADFARTENRARIESSATAEGNQQGNTDGLEGLNTPYTENDSNQHCSQEIQYTSTPSASYKLAFQTVYTRTCIQVYEDSYRQAYKASNTNALVTYETNKNLAAQAQEKERQDSNNRTMLLLGSGAVGSIVVGSAWKSRKKNSNS